MNDRERAALDLAVERALAEDLAYGPDATTEATVAADAVASAAITPRTAGVLAGLDAVRAVYDAVRPSATGDSAAVEISALRADGEPVRAGEPVAVVRGPARTLLTGERTMLNLLGHLSGIATATAAWVEAVAGTGCAVRDTRKTLAGWRILQKYAVRQGGGVNHRFGLGDAVLVKDNHVAAAGSVAAAMAAVRAHAPHLPCEVEVDTFEQLDEALAHKAELVLLDNFGVDECAEAVRRTRAYARHTRLEASGGLTLDVARAYAETGVDFLAVGALTHSVTALDIGLDIREERR